MIAPLPVKYCNLEKYEYLITIILKELYPGNNVNTTKQSILGREVGPSGVSPNQHSQWKHAFSSLKHV